MRTVSMLSYHYTIGILLFRKSNNLFHPHFWIFIVQMCLRHQSYHNFHLLELHSQIYLKVQ